MKRKTAAIVIVLLLLVLSGFFFRNPRPRQIRLELTGTTNLAVTGSYLADGLSNQIKGVLPLVVEATAREFHYQVRKASSDGELKGELFVGQQRLGHSIAQSPAQGVAGHYSASRFKESAGYTTLSDHASK